jgi:uncharacterized membrane protein YcaP (DUF421 family)
VYSVIRAIVVYMFLLLIFRFTGKRTLAEATSFDLVMLLIISETTQQAMIDGDNSMTHCFLLVITLVGMSLVLSILKDRSKTLERWLEDVPTIVVENGRWLKDKMRQVRVDEDDILSVARGAKGITHAGDIKYAIVEKDGNITVIPMELHKEDSAEKKKKV